jgi:hypothetical protein
MPVIVRPTKTVGTTYVEETASGKLDIIDEEIDRDFFNLYTGINRLDDDNIQPGKKIAYGKLDLAGKITAGDLVPGTINSAIPPNSIGPAQLVDGVIIDNKNNLGVGTTVWAQTVPAVGSDVPLPGTPVPNNAIESLVAETTWATRGGIWMAFAVLNGAADIVTGGSLDIIARLRHGGAAGADFSGAILQEHYIRLSNTEVTGGTGVIVVPYAAMLIASGALLPVSTQRLKLTLQNNNFAGSAGTGLVISSTRLMVMEQA